MRWASWRRPVDGLMAAAHLKKEEEKKNVVHVVMCLCSAQCEAHTPVRGGLCLADGKKKNLATSCRLLPLSH